MLKQLDSVASFVRVVERGSFLGVANELGTTQPRITRHIQALEADLGARLFERTTRGLTLTAAGQRFYPVAQRLLAMTEEAMQSISNEKQALSGKIRVVGPVVFGELVLADIVADFQSKHPEVSFELMLSDRNVNLIEEGAHCAFRGGALEDSSMVAVPLGHSIGVIAATKGYVKNHGQPKSPQELVNHPMASFHPRSPISDLKLVKAQSLKVISSSKSSLTPVIAPIHTQVFATTSQSADRVAASGKMIAVLPHYALDWYAKHFDFVRVLPAYCTVPNPIHAIYPSKHGITGRTRAFVEFVAKRTASMLAMRK
jgi:DNA-binding transcriptional LysR family regulator